MFLPLYVIHFISCIHKIKHKKLAAPKTNKNAWTNVYSDAENKSCLTICLGQLNARTAQDQVKIY